MFGIYTFCKKDGSIKLRYKFVCKCIALAQLKHRVITAGLHTEEYDCYSIPKFEGSTKERRNYVSKIRDVCDAFNVKLQVWYSYNEIAIDLYGDNVLHMIDTINKLESGCRLY